MRERLSEATSTAVQTPRAVKCRHGGRVWGWRSGIGAKCAWSWEPCSPGCCLPPVGGGSFSVTNSHLCPTTKANERDPQWSPDGKAFVAPRTPTAYPGYSRGIGAHDAAQLTKSNEQCNRPIWSPDGSTIYYTTTSGLWDCGASGGTSELVLEGARVAARFIRTAGPLHSFAGGKVWVGPLKGAPPKEMGQAPFPYQPRTSILLNFSPDGSETGRRR